MPSLSSPRFDFTRIKPNVNFIRVKSSRADFIKTSVVIMTRSSMTRRHGANRSSTACPNKPNSQGRGGVKHFEACDRRADYRNDPLSCGSISRLLKRLKNDGLSEPVRTHPGRQTSYHFSHRCFNDFAIRLRMGGLGRGGLNPDACLGAGGPI